MDLPAIPTGKYGVLGEVNGFYVVAMDEHLAITQQLGEIFGRASEPIHPGLDPTTFAAQAKLAPADKACIIYQWDWMS